MLISRPLISISLSPALLHCLSLFTALVYSHVDYTNISSFHPYSYYQNILIIRSFKIALLLLISSHINRIVSLHLCDMDSCMLDFPVYHQLPKLIPTHVHWVNDAIHPSHPAIPFSSCLQSFLASGSFPVSQSFTSGSQNIGVSASAPVLPMNIQDWFPLRLTGLISLQSKGLSRVFSNTTVQKHQDSALSFLYGPTPTSIHDYWKNHSFD